MVSYQIKRREKERERSGQKEGENSHPFFLYPKLYFHHFLFLNFLIDMKAKLFFWFK